MTNLFPLDEEQERLVADLLGYMTLDEKLGQLVLDVPAPTTSHAAFDEEVAAARIGGIGGVAKPDVAEAWQRLAVSRTRLGLPILFAPAMPDANVTGFSPWGAAASWDVKCLMRLGEQLADTARAAGCQFLPGPCTADENAHGEAPGVDLIAGEPRLLARLAMALVRGIQDEPLHGAGRVLAGLHHTPRGQDTLVRATGLLRTAVREARVGALGDLDSALAAKLAFAGIRLAECRRIVDLVGGAREWSGEQAERAIVEKRLSLGEIDDAVRGVLSAKTALGLIRDPYGVFLAADGGEREPAPLGNITRLDLRRRAMVLLRNERELLPLRSEFDHLLVVGPPEGAASACVAGLDGLGVACRSLPGLALRGPEGTFADVLPSDQLAIALTCDAARRSDLVLLALDQSAFTAAATGLPRLQPAVVPLIEALAAAQPNLVAVITTRTPVDLDESARHLPAVLLAWDGLDELATPLGEILTGEISPSGRLPSAVTSAVALASYPVGHGLGYGSVSYSDLALEPGPDRILVALTVRNGGEFEVLETVQIYLQPEQATAPYLAEFERVVLTPGEQRRIEIALGAEQIGLVDIDGRSVITPGRYEIRVGKNHEIALGGALDVSATLARSLALGRALRGPAAATGTGG